MVEPTYEIAEFLSERVHWLGDLDVEGAAALRNALQHWGDTGIWLGLPKTPEDAIDKRLEKDARAEAEEEQKRRVCLISGLEKKVRRNSLDRSAWASLLELYLKEGRGKDAEDATKTLLELDVRKLGKASPFTYRQLAEIYLAALSVSVRGKGIRILGYIPSNITAEALGYSIEELSEFVKDNLVKADWAYTKEGRDLALRAVNTLAVEAFEEFDSYKE